MEQFIAKSIQTEINRLYEDSNKKRLSFSQVARVALKGAPRPSDLKNLYLSISKEQGEFIFNLVVENKLKSIVEFGTSFGISTLYLAAAAENIGGHIVTSELLTEKAQVAQSNFEKAGVQDLIDLRVGDAIETLSKDINPIDFLLLDGWKDLYLPLLKQLENKLTAKGYIYVDNADMSGVRPTLDYLANGRKYHCEFLHKGKALLAQKK